jgi:hypothetical protein
MGDVFEVDVSNALQNKEGNIKPTFITKTCWCKSSKC